MICQHTYDKTIIRKIYFLYLVTEFSSHFKCLPNGDHITGIPRLELLIVLTLIILLKGLSLLQSLLFELRPGLLLSDIIFLKGLFTKQSLLFVPGPGFLLPGVFLLSCLDINLKNIDFFYPFRTQICTCYSKFEDALSLKNG